MGILSVREQPGGPVVKMSCEEKRWRELVERLNLFRLVPAEDIASTIKDVDRYIQTEFLMVTKL